jgi:hypothetical protein
MLLDTQKGNHDYVVKTFQTHEKIYESTNTKGKTDVNGISPVVTKETSDMLKTENLNKVDRNNLVELPEASSRQQMLNIVSADDGKGSGKNIAVNVTPFVQGPFIQDQNVMTGNAYVFGRGSKTLYLYNSTGVIATVPQTVFVK